MDNNESRKQSALFSSASRTGKVVAGWGGGLNASYEGRKFLRIRPSGDPSSNMENCLEIEPELIDFLVSGLDGYSDLQSHIAIMITGAPLIPVW